MVFVITDECIACGGCIEECPSDAISEGASYVIGESCVDCGACVDSCPVGAIIEK